MELKEYLHGKYQGGESFIEEVIYPIFGQDKFEDGFEEPILDNNPDLQNMAQQTGIKSITRLGTIQIPFNPTDVFDITVSDSVQMSRNRVGVQLLVRKIMSTYSSAFMVFHYEDNEKWDWRFTFCSKRDNSEDSTDSKRYTFLLGPNQSCRTAADNFKKLAEKRGDISLNDIVSAFDVEALSKEFYNKLYNWYQWALSEEINVTFPNNPEMTHDDRENINVKLIRLITRVLFVWFIKQKQLVPNNLFNLSYLKTILIDFDEKATDSGSYYNAILQNLFFATLNCAVVDEDGNPRRFATSKANRDTRNLFRYSEMFSVSEDEVLNLFAKIPFLNGGLFECLDKPKDLYLNLEHDILFDGFSRNATKASNGNYKYRAFVPNILFFNDDKQQPGLINLLSQYNFTIEENSPNDAVVSLDPELLGRVFENLLAAFNPETKESARKSTGSFYTPRSIVDYMVDESLLSYLLSKDIPGINENELRKIFRSHLLSEYWTEDKIAYICKTLLDVKILDPACGSGAFPVGCLLRMVDIIELLKKGDIDRYNLKLNIIENCVFGVDIQPIAMLTCKLRFFISLICEQNDIDFDASQANFGINTLPNLETKFVAANTLLSANIRQYDNDWTIDNELSTLKEELLNIRNEHFLAKGRKAKRQSQRLDEIKREEIRSHIIDNTNNPDNQFIEMREKQIEKLKIEAEKYQDELWIDTTRPVETTLFGIVETLNDTFFREDINKKKRDDIKSSIKILENEISKERSKDQLQGFEAAVKQITEWNPYDQNAISSFFDPEWMFCLKSGFDIVIGNPPYISTKGIKDVDKKLYEQEFGFSDDTYNLFSFKGLSLCKENGTLTYITPKTFWTTQTKRNMRDLMLSNTINYIFDTANPFEAAMVDTCITQVQKNKMNQFHEINFLDGSKNLAAPIVFAPIKQSIYVNAQNSVIFKPSDINLRIYELYGQKVKDLYDKWWDKIKTSRDIEKNKAELELYRASLKPGDIALLGCLTEGGQGLATANNGKYIAVRKSSKWAKNIIESRPKKLAEAIRKRGIIIHQLFDFDTEKDFLESLSEKDIASLFDELKEKYGRDIFGKGYIYKIIEDNELADVDSLTRDEKNNGIDVSKSYYVPYDKGDKDGNRWYLETPFAIAWSKENVRFLKTDPKARYQGYTFYFREGFSWTDINSTFLKARLKTNGVFDVVSMSLFTQVSFPDWYYVCLINTRFISLYVDNFINNTSHFQINDARQLPIVIPTENTLKEFGCVFRKAVNIKKGTDCSVELENLENELDQCVKRLYGI